MKAGDLLWSKIYKEYCVVIQSGNIFLFSFISDTDRIPLRSIAGLFAKPTNLDLLLLGENYQDLRQKAEDVYRKYRNNG